MFLVSRHINRHVSIQEGPMRGGSHIRLKCVNPHAHVPKYMTVHPLTLVCSVVPFLNFKVACGISWMAATNVLQSHTRSIDSFYMRAKATAWLSELCTAQHRTTVRKTRQDPAWSHSITPLESAPLMTLRAIVPPPPLPLPPEQHSQQPNGKQTSSR